MNQDRLLQEQKRHQKAMREEKIRRIQEAQKRRSRIIRPANAKLGIPAIVRPATPPSKPVPSKPVHSKPSQQIGIRTMDEIIGVPSKKVIGIRTMAELKAEFK